MPQIEYRDPLQFRLKSFFTHFDNINSGFLHNSFAGGGIKKAGLIAEPFHIVSDIFVVAHPYSANVRVMSADIFKQPFWVAAVAVSGIKDPYVFISCHGVSLQSFSLVSSYVLVSHLSVVRRRVLFQRSPSAQNVCDSCLCCPKQHI